MTKVSERFESESSRVNSDEVFLGEKRRYDLRLLGRTGFYSRVPKNSNI